MEAQLRPGTVIGRYTIVEVIGSGMSGNVYSATRAELRHQVALKLMHAEHPDSETERRRFAREAELVKRLQHPHVVPLLDYGHSSDGRPYLVFTRLRGRALDEKIRQDGAISWAATGRFSVQILRALEKAHGLGIVHRDIKPANIFMVAGVIGEVAQVLDFGLARMVGEPDEVDSDGQRVIAGTPRYMAPEQVRGGRIGHEADIYSFGLVMAEMLLGRALVQGDDEMQIYVAQGSDRPLDIPDSVLSSPFGTVIERALCKEVQVRYHLASQMLADVRAAVERMGAAEEDDDDAEADLEATAFLNPEEAKALLMRSPHAEKMLQALNLAASKAEATAASKRAPEIETETAEWDDEDLLDFDTALDEHAAATEASPEPPQTPAPTPTPQPPQAAAPTPTPQPTTQPTTQPTGQPTGEPMSPAPTAADLALAAATGDAPAPPHNRALLWVLLVLVIVLIGVGVAAILWLLGIVQLPAA